MREFCFDCPHCHEPFARTVELDIDIHAGATFTCQSCQKTVIFTAQEGESVRLPLSTYRALTGQPGRNKFNARTRCIDGLNFASEKEARRYLALKLLQRSGDVVSFRCHPVYQLTVAEQVIGRYTADFEIIWCTGEITVEDVKSKATKTEAYSLRKRVWQALYFPLVVTEV